MNYEIQLGLDTFSYYYGLSHKQKKAILKELKALPDFRTIKDDYENNSYVYASNYFSVRDSKSLTAALEKMCKEYDLSKSKSRTVLKKFRKLGISPITLQNSSKWGELPPIPI